MGLAWRRAGADEQLFVVDSLHQRIRAIRAPAGDWTRARLRTLAGSGTPVPAGGRSVVLPGLFGGSLPALAARFGFGYADTADWRGSAPGNAALALSPDGGLLYVSDPLGGRILAVDLGAETVRLLAGGGGNPRDGLAARALLGEPGGLAVLPGGDLVAAETGRYALRLLTLGD